MYADLNFHQLRIFHTVARWKSFSRAAQALDISQPAVSIQVQALERSLGISLFHRRAKGLQLTEAGERANNYAHRIFSLSSELQEAIHDIHELRTGHLTLGASTTPGEYILPGAIGLFRRQYPGVQVELQISNTRSIINQILQREIDLGMFGSSLERGNDELETSTYAMDEIVFVAGLSHPLAAGGPVSLDDVMEEGLVVREEGSATRGTAEECLARLGIQPKIAIELGSNQAVKLAAEAGVGVGVISRYGIGAEMKAGLLQVLNVEGWRLHPAPDSGLLEGEAPLPCPAGLPPAPGDGAPAAVTRIVNL